jgi:phospholipase C
MPPAIEHVIVLMLENRSFDHMVGYMAAMYPPGQFDGLSGTESNPDRHGAPVSVSDEASGVLPVGPDHSHQGVLWQLTGKETSTPQDPITNMGFVHSYEHTTKSEGNEDGDDIMQCFSPPRLPVLAALARGFAICDRWFCSVPGETWPNRNYVHAATSDGEVNIKRRFYRNRTVFELLMDAGEEWTVYHQGPAQVWVFPRLWQSPFSRANRFRPLEDLPADIRGSKLPAYTFVEPDHGLLWPHRRSNSQHPSNNLKVPRDFYAGERLLLDIYTALIETPDMLMNTLFFVTYDEHGGYYDHVPPPRNAPPAVAPDDKTKKFGFNLLGPRVPAVVVSPWIRAGTVDSTIFDHSAVPASLRVLFGPNMAPLTRRDAASKTLWHNLTLARPRLPADMPSPDVLSAALDGIAGAELATTSGVGIVSEEPEPELDDFQESLIELAVQVDMALTTTPPGFEALVGEDFTPIAAITAAPFRRNAEERATYLEGMERRFRTSGFPPPPPPPLDGMEGGGTAGGTR